MANTEMLHVRIDPATKKAAQAIFGELGMTTGQAVRMFLRQVEVNQGLPFSLNIPNAETRAAIEEAEAGGGERMTVKEFSAYLKSLQRNA